MNLKILTYNIRHGVSKSDARTLGEIIGFLAKSGADLVGIQEVDGFAKRSGFADQPERIKKSLTYNAVFAPSLILPPESAKKPKREYGLMSLSRFPVAQTKTHFLRKSDYAGKWFTESRVCLEVTVGAQGRKVVFFVLHLDTHEMEKQVENLIAILGKTSLPKILAGDFNVPPENENIKLIQERLKLKNVMAGDSTPTYEDDKGKKQIDYIFVSEDFTVRGAKVLDADFSDHKPLWAEVSI